MTELLMSPRQRRDLLEQVLRDRIAAAAPDPYATHVNPQLARLLHGVGLDKRFVRGEGSWLEDADGLRYLDFTGAYGALPFGHNPAAVWEAVTAVRDRAEPTFVQPSLLRAAGELAARLVELAPGGLDRVTFANSGAEAIEVALKIARSATGRPGILTTDNAFHGKTLGALSATGRAQYQQDFGAPVAGFERVPYGDADALATALAARPGTVAAFVVEPIQGEGGVVRPPDGYLRAVRDICTEHGVLFVLDEVQTGLGRTGRLFAAQHEDVVPDVLTLAKALGGGVVPAAAVLCRSALATEGFSLRHTSTFAGNAIACRAGLRTLELLTADDEALVRHVAETGARLERGLRDIQGRYPGTVTEVRGRGFLLGVELTDDIDAFGGQGLLGSAADQENLAMLVCSHLLAVERVRLAPTLFGARVLRVEPPLTATAAEVDRFLGALDRTLARVHAGDSAGLLAHLVGQQAGPVPPRRRGRPATVPARPGDRRFAFVVHPLDLASFRDFDPALAAYGDAELDRLVDRFDAASSVLNPAPFLVGSGRVAGAGDSTAFGEFIGLPYTARHLMELPSPRAVRVVREAVELARDRGAELVGLGAYSSVVTGNAEHLGDVGVRLTTGNGFTVAAALRGVRQAAALRGLDLDTATVAVVGATGAIGSAAARLLAGEVGRLVLVGNPAHPAVARRRLEERAAELLAALPADPAAGPLAAVRSVAEALATGLLRLETDPAAALPGAGVVIVATSSPRPLVDAALLAPDAIVCDVSQPPNVPESVTRDRPDVLLFDGGIIRLPEGRGLGVRYGLPDGFTYACMAETMLLALSGDVAPASIGDRLGAVPIRRLQELAGEHGFDLARSRPGGSDRANPERTGHDHARRTHRDQP